MQAPSWTVQRRPMLSMVKPPMSEPKTAPPEKVETIAPIMALVSVVWKNVKKFSLLMTTCG